MAVKLFESFDPAATTQDAWLDTLKATIRVLKVGEPELLYVLEKHSFPPGPKEKKGQTGPLILVGKVDPAVLAAMKGRLRGHLTELPDGTLEANFDKNGDKGVKAMRLALKGKVPKDVVLKEHTESPGLGAKLKKAIKGAGEGDWERRAAKVQEKLDELEIELQSMLVLDANAGATTATAELMEWGAEQFEAAKTTHDRGHAQEAYKQLDAVKAALEKGLTQARAAAAALEEGSLPPAVEAPPKASGQEDYERRRQKAEDALSVVNEAFIEIEDREPDDSFLDAMEILDDEIKMCAAGMRLADAHARAGQFEKAYAELERVKEEAKRAAASATRVLAAYKAGTTAPRLKAPVPDGGQGELFDQLLAELRRDSQKLDAIVEDIVSLDPNDRAVRSLRRSAQDVGESFDALTDLRDAGTPEIAWPALKDARKELDRHLADAQRTTKRLVRLAPIQPEDSPVPLVGAILPGVEHLSPRERLELVERVNTKIVRGRDLMGRLLTGDFARVQPTRENIADVMWYLRVKSEEKSGEAWERGAMTIPDPDKKIRAWLDGNEQIYARGSSHMRDQQEKSGNVGRGIDFYEGVDEETGVAKDDSLLLPYGMRTLLMQSMETAGGDSRLYLKMETESARLGGSLPSWLPFVEKIGGVRSLNRGESVPQSRPQRGEDVGRGPRHAANLFKSAEEKGGHDLSSKKEKVPKQLLEAYEEIRAAAELAGKPGKTSLAVLDHGKWKKSVHQIFENLKALIVLDDVPDAVYQAAVPLSNALAELSDIESRVGEEVVLNPRDLVDL
jgi:hypothetical protein